MSPCHLVIFRPRSALLARQEPTQQPLWRTFGGCLKMHLIKSMDEVGAGLVTGVGFFGQQFKQDRFQFGRDIAKFTRGRRRGIEVRIEHILTRAIEGTPPRDHAVKDHA